MSATNAFETALLNLYFTNTDHANVGDAGGLNFGSGAKFIKVSSAAAADVSGDTWV
jgi:hypothetical protein